MKFNFVTIGSFEPQSTNNLPAYKNDETIVDRGGHFYAQSID